MILSVLDDESLGVTIIEGIAEQKECPPSELPERLADVIDPDALEELFSPTTAAVTSANPTVRFRFSGYGITVTGNREVHIERPVGTDTSVAHD